MGRGFLSFILVALKLTTILAEDLDWWKTAVIYQIYPRSFKDTDGDGVGDLQGIIDSIEYIKQLGVNAVWLSPVYPTANKDFGYDITDMKAINKELGNMTQFEDLVRLLHQAGIKIIMDFVPNHTSNKHEWFLQSLQGNNDTYKDYYVWRSGKTNAVSNKMSPPNNWYSDICAGSAWTYEKSRKQFYLHQFLSEQPDLNYENPAVLLEMQSVLEFWLNKDVDGFRMDAVYTICENQDFADEKIGPNGERYHEKTSDQDKTFDMLRAFRIKMDQFTKHDNFTRLMMVENYNSNPKIIKRYYGTKDAPIAHFPFNFYLIMNLTRESNATDWAHCINEWYNYMGEENHPNWVIGNHDQHRVATRFSEDYVDLLNIIVLILKGTAITYNGEEIGMLDSLVRQDQAQDPQGKNASSYSDFISKSRDPERGPFLWNTNTTSGFSSSLQPWIPVSASYWRINVKTQNDSARSHLNIYREMITLRQTNTLKYGNVQVLSINDTVLAIYRYYNDNPTVAAIINFDSHEQKVDLSHQRNSLPNQLYFYTASLNVNDIKDKDNKFKVYNTTEITLPPKGALVLTTKPLK